MNKRKKIITALLISLLLLSIAPVSVLAKNQANHSVLPDKVNINSAQSSLIEKKSPKESAAEKINSSKVMKVLLLSSDNMQSFGAADEYNSDIKYTAKFNDGSTVDFDQDMNIVAYCNFDRTSKNSRLENDKIIDALKQEYNIDETYQQEVIYEANKNGKDDTKYYWSKTDENGCINFYDSLSVRIDGNTNEIVIFNRFNDVSEVSEIKITETEAKRIALSVKEEFNKVTEFEKMYVKPNYFWNEEEYTDANDEPVRLVYNVCIDKKYYVYVDAETGKVLGGDMKKCISE